jgi:hypothetical protein
MSPFRQVLKEINGRNHPSALIIKRERLKAEIADHIAV